MKSDPLPMHLQYSLLIVLFANYKNFGPYDNRPIYNILLYK